MSDEPLTREEGVRLYLRLADKDYWRIIAGRFAKLAADIDTFKASRTIK